MLTSDTNTYESTFVIFETSSYLSGTLFHQNSCEFDMSQLESG